MNGCIYELAFDVSLKKVGKNLTAITKGSEIKALDILSFTVSMGLWEMSSRQLNIQVWSTKDIRLKKNIFGKP